MIEKFFTKPKYIDQLKTISFGSSIDDFAEYLHNQGAASHTIQYYLRVAGHFSYWLKGRRISLHSVNEAIVDKFLFKHLKRCSCPVMIGSGFIKLSRPALKLFLKLLRNYHLIPLPPKPKPPPITPIDKLLLDFRDHLQKVRGLTPDTIYVCLHFTRGFLKAKYKDRVINLHALNVNDVREYVATKAKEYKAISLLGTALRTFFRFLKMSDQIEQSLENAVPIIPVPRRLANIPKYITEEQLQCLLSSFDLSTPNGLRDRAVTLLMAKMGLRLCEVAQLTLDDINWRQGIFQLKKTKARHSSSLPLIKGVGKALVTYLQKGRPHTKERAIFVTHSMPAGKPFTTGGMRNIIYRAFKHSGLSVPFRSPHVLRHTFATHLLKKNAKLKEIADVLRHRSIETTKIYAKVDLKQLAEVALPWPEVKNHEVRNTLKSYRRLYRVSSQTRIWHDRRQETPLSVCPIRR